MRTTHHPSVLSISVLFAAVGCGEAPVEAGVTRAAVSQVVCGDDCGPPGDEETVPISRGKGDCDRDGISDENVVSCLPVQELMDPYDQCTSRQTGNGCITGFHVAAVGNRPQCNLGGEPGFPDIVNALFCEGDDEDYVVCGATGGCPDLFNEVVASLRVPGCTFPRNNTDTTHNARRCVELPVRQP